MRRQTTLPMAALCALLIGPVCGGTLAAHAQTAEIRVVHAAPGTGSIDAIVGDTALGDAAQFTSRSIAYASASRSFQVDTGSTRVRVRSSSDPGATILAGDLRAVPGQRLDVVLLNEPAFIESATMTYPIDMPVSGDAVHLRVFNAAANAAPFDVTLRDVSGAAVVDSAVGFKHATTFGTFAPGLLEVEATDRSTGERMAYGVRLIEGGTNATVLIIGVPGALRIVLLDEARTAPQSPLLQFGDGQSRVRFVNVGAPTMLSSFLLDTMSVAAVGADSATAMASTTAGAHSVGFVPVDGTVHLDGRDVDCRPNTAYTVFAYGTAPGDFHTSVLDRLTDRATASDSVRVRLVNVSAVDVPLHVVALDRNRNQMEASLAAGGSTEYTSLRAGRVSFVIDEGDGTVLARRSGAFHGGSTMTLLLSGGSDQRSLRVLALDDSDEQVEALRSLEEATGRLRVVNLVASGSAYDAFIGDASVPAATVDYREASEAVRASDSVRLRIAPTGAGAGAAVIDTVVVAGLDSLTEVFLVPQQGRSEPRAEVLQSYVGADATPETMQLRMLNAVTQPAPLDLSARPSTGSELRYDLGIGTFVDFTPIAAGDGMVVVYTGTHDSVMIAAPVPFDAGRHLTLIATGSNADGDHIVLSLLFDDDTTAQRPLWMLRDPAAVPTNVAAAASGVSIHPNPVSQRCSVSFDLARACGVRLVLVDDGGRVVSEVFEGARPAGRSDVLIDATAIPAGHYFLVLTGSSGHPVIRRLIVVR